MLSAYLDDTILIKKKKKSLLLHSTFVRKTCFQSMNRLKYSEENTVSRII